MCVSVGGYPWWAHEVSHWQPQDGAVRRSTPGETSGSRNTKLKAQRSEGSRGPESALMVCPGLALPPQLRAPTRMRSGQCRETLGAQITDLAGHLSPGPQPSFPR